MGFVNNEVVADVTSFICSDDRKVVDIIDYPNGCMLFILDDGSVARYNEHNFNESKEDLYTPSFLAEEVHDEEFLMFADAYLKGLISGAIDSNYRLWGTKEVMGDALTRMGIKRDKVYPLSFFCIDDLGDLHIDVSPGKSPKEKFRKESVSIGGKSREFVKCNSALVNYTVGESYLDFPYLLGFDEESTIVSLGFGSILGDRVVDACQFLDYRWVVLCASGDVYVIGTASGEPTVGEVEPVLTGIDSLQFSGDETYCVSKAGKFYRLSQGPSGISVVNLSFFNNKGVRHVNTNTKLMSLVRDDGKVEILEVDSDDYLLHEIIEEGGDVSGNLPAPAVKSFLVYKWSESKNFICYILLDNGKVARWSKWRSYQIE